ncbi:MAG: hypothetical protein ABR599_03045 [Gemmatimonadota bacterium]
MESPAERLIVLQDLRELRQEMSDEGEVAQLEAMGFEIADRQQAAREMEDAIESLRASLPPSLLRRFERVARKYRRPIAPVRGGTCYGCFTRFPTSRLEPAEAPDGVASCPNCGRLVYEI